MEYLSVTQARELTGLRLVLTVGVPVDVDWVAAGTLPRAAYKAQRVIDATE